MEILLFQAFIVASLVIARAISTKALVIAAVGWTIFTLIMVFAAPLILLQLLVIWFAYGSLAPKDKKLVEVGGAGGVRTGRVQPHYAPGAKQKSDQQSASFGNMSRPQDPKQNQDHATYEVNGLFGQLTEAVEDLNSGIAKKIAIKENICEVEASLNVERVFLETALRSAESEVEFEEKLAREGEDFRQSFYRNREKLLHRLDDYNGENAPKSLAMPSLPDFTIRRRHSDPEMAVAIEDEYRSLERERYERVTTLLADLERKPKLEAAFWERVGERGKYLLLDSLAKSRFARKSKATLVSRNQQCSSSEPWDHKSDNPIAALARTLAVPYLVHFTQVQNLPSIMKHGLRSVSQLQAAGIPFAFNDGERWDRQKDTCCLSIAHPNERLFYRWRMADRQVDWVVLVLATEVLWKSDAAFCANNAADARMSQKALEDRQTPASFEAMFAEQATTPHRDLQSLRSYDPSDVQAEVLVFDEVSPKHIVGAAFSNLAALSQYRSHLGSRRVQRVPEGTGFFGLRSEARKAKWEF